MPTPAKLPRNRRKETELFDMTLEMQHLSGKYPDEMLGVIIYHLRTSTTEEQRSRVRKELDGLIATLPLSDHPHANRYVH